MKAQNLTTSSRKHTMHSLCCVVLIACLVELPVLSLYYASICVAMISNFFLLRFDEKPYLVKNHGNILVTKEVLCAFRSVFIHLGLSEIP